MSIFLYSSSFYSSSSYFTLLTYNGVADFIYIYIYITASLCLPEHAVADSIYMSRLYFAYLNMRWLTQYICHGFTLPT